MSTRVTLLVVTLLSGALAVRAAKVPPPNMLSLVQAQCAGRCSCAADPDCGTAGSCAGGLCVAGSLERVSCNAVADCAAGQSCTSPPRACSPDFTLTGGTAVLKSLAQPKPTCPRTGMPEENNVGQVKLTGVAKAGTPFTGELGAAVTLKATFGPDPDPACPGGAASEECCPLAGLQITVAALSAPDLVCRNGKCRGRFVASDCLPAPCRDTVIVAEFVSLVVFDEAGAPLATPGIFLGALRSRP